MAFNGPCYGLSRECQLKAQAKFDMSRALQAIEWIKEVTKLDLTPANEIIRDQYDFADCLKDGVALCSLINILNPNSRIKINTMKTPFKQRENLEMCLKGCLDYGLKAHDLFQVNDLYERKNLYIVVNFLFALGGVAQKKGFDGPTIGVKVANENRRSFSKETLNQGKSILSLQAGNYKGATQSKMTPYGSTRQIIPEAKLKRK